MGFVGSKSLSSPARCLNKVSPALFFRRLRVDGAVLAFQGLGFRTSSCCFVTGLSVRGTLSINAKAIQTPVLEFSARVGIFRSPTRRIIIVFWVYSGPII